MQKVICRTATLTDLPILLDFEQGIVAAERPYDETLQAGSISYYDIKAMIKASNAEVLVAVVDNRIVGSAYARIDKAKPYLKHTHYAHLGFMYVHPDYRGQGINKDIIIALKEWAQSKGIKEVRLNVYNDNHSAIRAYEKVGFARHMINMRLEI